MADIGFKYTAGKGEITPPTNADPNALYLTDGRLYKGRVLIADKSPDTYTWDKITAKPTTLAGYGIEDGATKGELTSLSTKVSSAETNISNLSSYVAQNTTSISNIINGTTAVGKAISDENGRNIADEYFRYRAAITNDTNADSLTQFGLWVNTTGNGTGNSNFPNTYGTFISFPGSSNYGGVQINVTNKNVTKIRNYWSNTWSDWVELAKITDTVASANKLATPRTIWGQSFDGSGNVSGNITGSNFLLQDHLYNPFLQLTDTSGTVYFQCVNGDAYMGSTAPKSLMVDKQGNVGIGTTAPQYKLDVAGTGRFTGNLIVPTINSGTPITSSNIGSQTVAQALELTDSNGNVTYTVDDITAIDNKFANYSPIEGSASLTKYSGGNFGNAAAKNYTTSVQSNNANLVTSGAVYSYLSSYAYKSDVPSIGIFMATQIQNGVLRCEYVQYFGEEGSWSGNSDIYDGNIIMIINPNNINGNFTSWMDIDHDFEAECGTQCTIYSGSGITLAALNYKLYPTNYL